MLKRYPKRKLLVSTDGSVLDQEGNVVLFSTTRFKQEIVGTENCFLCGRSPSRVPFNDEHVIPDWLLSALKMHGQKITLPNGATFQYGRYKLPCCIGCNSLLGREIEIPVSKLMKGGQAAVVKHILRDGRRLIFLWMALIFLKIHLKAMFLRMHLDQRVASFQIGELFDWASMHHIHCLVRSVLTGPRIRERVVGSLFVLMAKEMEGRGRFDYADYHEAKSLMLRFNNTVIYTVFDDACATYSLLKDHKLSEIAGPLSPIQAREVFARITYTRLLVKNPPRFQSLFGDGYYTIDSEQDESIIVGDHDPVLYGRLLSHSCQDLLSSVSGPEAEEAKRRIPEGRWTFLFDSNGKFVKDSMEPIEAVSNERGT